HDPEATDPSCATSGEDKISYATLPNFHATSPIHPQDLDWIPKAASDSQTFGDGRFFGVDYGGGRVLTADLHDFDQFCGDLLITREYPNDGWFAGTSGLSTLRWNPSTASFDVTVLSTPTGFTASQWEHVTFRGGTDCKSICTGVIGDFVWKDLNGDGVQDSTEPGIAGVTVTLTMPSVPLWKETTLTDSTGH